MGLLQSKYDQWLDAPTPERFVCEACFKEVDQAGSDEGLCVDCNTWDELEERLDNVCF